ncbi:reverse transcriptase domain-containing protein [Tanacetum coccineum]
MPNNVKTYDESDYPEDHLKIFQAAAKVERWAMPTWCHMFNSTLTGSARVWFDDLPLESIDSYDDLKKAFLANYLQQKKCIKDPVEIHHIKRREGESTEDFVQRFKAKSRHVKGALECMRIFGFMHGITNPELIKRLHDNIPKSVDEMMREVGRKQNFDKRGDFKNQQRSERRRDKFTLLTKSPKEILALDKGKFKAPPPMTTPRQIKGLIKNGKLLHVIKELKQDSGKDQPKTTNKGETFGKDMPLAILMVLGGVLTLRSSKIIPLECMMVSGPGAQPFDVIQAVEERIKVAIHLEYPKQTITISSTLTEEGRKALCDLLRRSLNVIAWKPADMTGVLRHISKHRLNVRERCSQVRQKKRSQAPERNKAIQEEVEKLADAGIIKEVHYHSWLSNPVMVKKHDDSWRMCVDFKDLNNACPKDGYPLLEID